MKKKIEPKTQNEQKLEKYLMHARKCATLPLPLLLCTIHFLIL